MSRRNFLFAFVAGCMMVAAVAPQALAQRGQGGRGGGMGGMMGGPLMLLRVQDIQDDLQLTADQKDKLRDLAPAGGGGMREAMAGLQDLSPEERRAKMGEIMRENQEKTKKQLAGILKPDQMKRLDEIQLQATAALGGLMAVTENPDLAKTLAITPEQKTKIDALQQQLRDKRMESMQGMRDLSQEERTAKMAEMQKTMLKDTKELSDKAREILTPQQREAIEKAMGKKLNIDFSTIAPQGGGRGRRGKRLVESAGKKIEAGCFHLLPMCGTIIQV